MACNDGKDCGVETGGCCGIVVCAPGVGGIVLFGGREDVLELLIDRWDNQSWVTLVSSDCWSSIEQFSIMNSNLSFSLLVLGDVTSRRWSEFPDAIFFFNADVMISFLMSSGRVVSIIMPNMEEPVVAIVWPYFFRF